jgi:hypothetical protein
VIRPLSDYIVHMQLKYPVKYVPYLVLRQSGFNYHDLEHLVMLGILTKATEGYHLRKDWYVLRESRALKQQETKELDPYQGVA